MRIRITFAKTDAMRYTSHLDLHRTWERTFRRAQLPLAYSQGFNPHPRLNLASALPLGMTGEAEVIDAWLEQDLPLDEIQAALVKAAPPGIQVRRIEWIEDREPTLQVILDSSEFIITFLEPVPDLRERISNLLESPALPRERRGKPYDLRPLIFELVCLPDDDGGCQRAMARLNADQAASGRPEEVILALGFVPEMTRVHRTRILFKSSE